MQLLGAMSLVKYLTNLKINDLSKLMFLKKKQPISFDIIRRFDLSSQTLSKISYFISILSLYVFKRCYKVITMKDYRIVRDCMPC